RARFGRRTRRRPPRRRARWPAATVPRSQPPHSYNRGHRAIRFSGRDTGGGRAVRPQPPYDVAMLALWIVALLALGTWLWLALLRGRFWWTDVRLPAAPEPPRWPSVAVVVPARNEAEILPHTVPTLLALRYPGPLQVIRSEEHTSELQSR